MIHDGHFSSHQYLELHRWTFENSLLLLHRHGAMQGQNPGTFTSLEMDVPAFQLRIYGTSELRTRGLIRTYEKD